MHSLERQDDREPRAGPPGVPAGDRAEVRRIEDLPKEVGAMLVSVGLLGFALPGMVGAPAIIAGGLVLWPRAFGKVDGWFRRRFPAAHELGMRQVGRYLDDLERRYSDLEDKGDSPGAVRARMGPRGGGHHESVENRR